MEDILKNANINMLVQLLYSERLQLQQILQAKFGLLRILKR